MLNLRLLVKLINLSRGPFLYPFLKVLLPKKTLWNCLSLRILHSPKILSFNNSPNRLANLIKHPNPWKTLRLKLFWADQNSGRQILTCKFIARNLRKSWRRKHRDTRWKLMIRAQMIRKPGKYSQFVMLVRDPKMLKCSLLTNKNRKYSLIFPSWTPRQIMETVNHSTIQLWHLFIRSISCLLRWFRRELMTNPWSGLKQMLTIWTLTRKKHPTSSNSSMILAFDILPITQTISWTPFLVRTPTTLLQITWILIRLTTTQTRVLGSCTLTMTTNNTLTWEI